LKATLDSRPPGFRVKKLLKLLGKHHFGAPSIELEPRTVISAKQHVKNIG
jgi:hypothetical protein